MKHAVHNFITPACRTNGLPDRHVERATHGEVVEAGAGPAAGCTQVYATAAGETLTSGKHCRSQVYLAPSFSKRKYEDMTSRRIDEVEAENDHDLSSKLSFFRENKRRRPPEADSSLVLMQVQDIKVQDQSKDEFQVRKRSSTPRSGSPSRIVITPEVCGDSDLTAENLMAEESSRSSDNDGLSKFESAAESVSKRSIREPRSGSSIGVFHCFLDQPEGNTEDRIPFSESPGHQRQQVLGRNDDHISFRQQMEDMNESEGVAKLEPVTCYPLGSSELRSDIQQHQQQTTPQAWSKGNEQSWLQLGVGPSPNTASSNSRLDSAAECNRESPSSQQGNVERPYGKRKTSSIDFQISGSRERDSISPANANMASVQRQAQRGPVLQKLEPNFDSTTTINPPSFVTLPSSSFSRSIGVPNTGPNYNLEKDLCLFGNIVTAASTQIDLGHSGSVSREHTGFNERKSERNLAMSSLLSGSLDNRHQGEPQGSKYPGGSENLLLAGVGKSGIYNRALPSFLWRSGEDAQFKSPQTAPEHPVQFQGDNRRTSLAALMHPNEDQRQQPGQTWLPASDSAQKLIPLASNFQGWSSDMTASTRTGSGSDQVAIERHPNSVDLHVQRTSDEWGNLLKKNPNMLFPSQGQLADTSSRMLDLEKNVAAGHDSMGSFKRAIKIHNRPQSQWTTSEPTNFGSVASWCLNGGKPLTGTRADKLEGYGGERPVMPPMLPDRLPVQGRYPVEQILSTKQQQQQQTSSQRQSWQPAAGQPKLQHGNTNILRGSRSAQPSVSKPRFQVLPPVPRGTNQAGLWFVLQSAENQNGEGGLPQISKAYLRIQDGKMPVSAVKKYLVTKLGLASEAEVEITCRGQPVVPNLPLQHVRDVIWYSSLNPSKDQTTTTSGSGDRDDSTTSADQRVRPEANCNPAIFSKDVVMVLTYRRHPRTMPPQHC